MGAGALGGFLVHWWRKVASLVMGVVLEPCMANDTKNPSASIK